MTTSLNIDVHQYRQPTCPIHDLLLRRWSPRSMSGQPITLQQLMTLLEAARWAPSARNEQPWRFLHALRNTPDWPIFLDLIFEPNRLWAGNGAALLLLVSKRTFTQNNQPNPAHLFDAGAAWENLALQATAMGLVSHALGAFDAEKARRALAVPDDFSICIMIVIGHPGRPEDLPPQLAEREKPSSRKPLSELVFPSRFPT